MFTPLLTQVRPCYFSVDCGMSYIVRLDDGKFIIIDGNVGEYDEVEHLYSLLCEQNELEGEPKIAAWFITHPHGDHFRAFAKFFETYGDRVVIEKVLYHFPVPGIFESEGSERSDFDKVISEIKAEIITPRTGDVFEFPGARFEVLFCCEDLYPGPIKNINDSSFVMMMDQGNYKVLWLGDLQRVGSDYLCAHTDKKKLKCDILQVGHHGYNGGSDELYRAADPEYLLWPCPDFWFHPVRLWECTDYLINSKNIKATFVAGQEELTFDMTAPIKAIDPYREREITADFAKKSLFALGWSCSTGGKSGFAPAKLEFTDGGCRLTAEDAFTLCHIIHRGQTAKASRYSFEFSGELKSAELFGLMFDHDKIMEWKDGACFELSPKGAFDYKLFVDRNARSAELFDGNSKIAKLNDISGEPRDILIVMKNAELELSRVIYRQLD